MNLRRIILSILLSCSVISLSGCVVESTSEGLSERATKMPINKELGEMFNVLQGEYADIDKERIDKISKEISNGDIDTIKMVMKDPNSFEPPILFAYSEQVFKSGNFDVAMFWYYTAQLRARSDANKSLDKSVHKGVTGLSVRYGSVIGKYALENQTKLKDVMKNVIEWDKISERSYNPKWVALLGDEAKFSSVIRFVSPNKYKTINDEVRKGWEAGFETAMKQLKEKEDSK